MQGVSTSNIQPSVIYRDGPLKADDYREAITALEDALKQPEHRGDGCTICWDTDHFADTCHHNPLLAARHWACNDEENHWRCFQCGAVFALTEEAEAQEHFGTREDEPAACVAEQGADGE